MRRWMIDHGSSREATDRVQSWAWLRCKDLPDRQHVVGVAVAVVDQMIAPVVRLSCESPLEVGPVAKAKPDP